ncbi:ABC transporter permease subunit [Streptomyces sp. NPDC055078]
MTAVTPYRSTVTSARDGFRQLLRAEWTKLRTVGRWSLTLLATVAVTVLVSVLSASGSSAGGGGEGGPPVGPDGLIVEDSFRFAHRTLQGDGSITARVSGLTGDPSGRDIPEWAKAGVLVKDSTRAGSPYAAVMMTKDHGVRLQSRFTRDTAGSATPSSAPRWLRLVRAGSTLTGYQSADGSRWQAIGTVRLDRLPKTVEAGLFVASPNAPRVQRDFGSSSVTTRATRATAVFDGVVLTGAAGGAWQDTGVGAGTGDLGPPGGQREDAGGVKRSGDTFTVTGSGDIGPAPGPGDSAAQSFSGSQLGLILVAALGALFITAEYRRGMIRTTLTASSRRGRVLLAKATVLGGVSFAVGLVATAVAYAVATPIMRDNGFRPPLAPDTSLTDGPVLLAVAGTAAVFALTAVLALGVGALLRHTAAAITVVVVGMVLPLILIGSLPLPLAQWLQRLTPAAGFAVQETGPRYEQVTDICLPEDGCYPQGAWAGFATLCAYAAVVLALAVRRLRRNDV